jgi:hypothetical protein
LGQQELVTRIQTGHSSTYSEIFRDTRRPVSESRDVCPDSGRLSRKDNNAIKSTQPKSKSKTIVQPSSSRVRSNTANKSENSELDDAIQKQRDFLNGFVKKA